LLDIPTDKFAIYFWILYSFFIVSCVKDNGGCQQICVVHGYVAKCECYFGYRLQTDEKSCKAGEILWFPIPKTKALQAGPHYDLLGP
jgi:hypothetical protein